MDYIRDSYTCANKSKQDNAAIYSFISLFIMFMNVDFIVFFYAFNSEI